MKFVVAIMVCSYRHCRHDSNKWSRIARVVYLVYHHPICTRFCQRAAMRLFVRPRPLEVFSQVGRLVLPTCIIFDGAAHGGSHVKVWQHLLLVGKVYAELS